MPLSLVLAPRALRHGWSRALSAVLRRAVQLGVCDDALLQALHEGVITETGQMGAGILVWYGSVTNTNVSV